MRLRNIDILRGIAALSVVLFHLTGSTGLSKSIVSIGKYGYLGVEVFFVISGMVLPYSMAKNGYVPKHFFRFLIKRIIRINPPYFVTITLTVIFAYFVGLSLPTLQSLLAHTLYLNDLLGRSWVSPVFWTLALEFQFYILLGLSFNIVMMKNDLYPILFIGLILTTSLFLPNTLLPHWFGMFAIGIIFFRKRHFHTPNIIYYPTLLLILFFITINNGLPEAIASLFGIFFIQFVKLKDNHIFIKIGLWLGTISYSLYLVHWDFGRAAVAFSRHLPIVGQYESLRIIFGLSMSLLGAYCFYILIEKPSIRLSKIFHIKL